MKIVCVLLPLALLVAPAASYSSDLYYYAFEERIQLTASSDKVIVRFAEETDISSLITSVFGNRLELKLEFVDNRTSTIEGKPQEIVELTEYLVRLPELKTINPIYLTNDGSELGVTDEVCVEFLERVSELEKEELYRDFGVKEIPSQSIFYTILTVPREGNALDVANRIQESGLVRYSHPNFIVEAQYTQLPNDEYFDMQFALNNTGQVINDGHTGTPDADVDAPEAWEITTGNPGIIVSVTDDGVPLNHPDLPVTRLEVINGCNFNSGPSVDPDDPTPTGDNSHGTCCAGIVAAEQNNDQGVSGIAPGCHIMPIKYPDESASVTVFADAIDFAWQHGADVMSNSWSTGYNPFPAIIQAIQRATTNGRGGLGAVVVWSAGNTANHEHGDAGAVKFPGNVDVAGVLTVGASDRFDQQANYSPTSPLVDVVAPSQRAYPQHIATESREVWSTDLPGNAGRNPYKEWPHVGEQLPNSGANFLDYTGRFGGTSAAAPLVAGIAALVLSVNPTLTQQEVFDCITTTADDVGGYAYVGGRCDEMGHGRVNAARAVGPDLWMQDTPADAGFEPNPDTGPMWESQDIWVNPSLAGTTHENPICGVPTYVHVKVRNRSWWPGTGNLKVYWAKASTGLKWDDQWVNYIPDPPFGSCPPGVLYGDLLPTESINLAGFGEDVVEIPWDPPDPEDFACFGDDKGHFCLLARIETETAFPYGMWSPETENLYDNVRNNNNIVWKNVTVHTLDDERSSGSHGLITRRTLTGTGLVHLHFTFPIPFPKRSSFLDIGDVLVGLSEPFIDAWQFASYSGFEVVTDPSLEIPDKHTTMRMTASSGDISDIPMDSGEAYIFDVEFRLFDESECLDEEVFDFDVIQYSDQQQMPDGGMDYDVRVGSCPVISIEKTHNTLQGHYEYVSITTESSYLNMGGFDFLIAYDASALAILEATPGQLLEDCGWEYFTYRYGVHGNCGDACPSGLLRIVAIADLSNGPNHPSCFGAPDCDPHELAELQFYVSNNRIFECQYVPVYFFWSDCGDNTISSITGDTLFLDHSIYDYAGNMVWDEGDDEEFPESARIPYVGAPDYCMTGDKRKPIRCGEYRFGGIDIACADSIDVRGDINLNGVENEIADAVLYTNYFLYGISVFDIAMEGQIAASDVNNDGIPLSVGDLVYLIRIITGDALPFPKLAPYAQNAEAGLTVDQTGLVVSTNSPTDIGAGYFLVESTGYEFGEPYLTNGASGMTLKYHEEDGALKVLVYSMEKGRRIAAGTGNIFAVSLQGEGTIALNEVQLCDYYGNMLMVTAQKEPALPKTFALEQNYPNPFNPITEIRFSLPQAAHVELEVFNALGQQVAVLVDTYLEAGYHSATWDGSTASSGVYFYRITAGSFTDSKKMILLK
jgi:subtilisin family serine protease